MSKRKSVNIKQLRTGTYLNIWNPFQLSIILILLILSENKESGRQTILQIHSVVLHTDIYNIMPAYYFCWMLLVLTKAQLSFSMPLFLPSFLFLFVVLSDHNSWAFVETIVQFGQFFLFFPFFSNHKPQHRVRWTPVQSIKLLSSCMFSTPMS